MFNMRMTLVGGSSNHVNYIANLVQAFGSKLTVGVSKAKGKEENNDEDYAQMDRVMSLVLNEDASLDHIASYTNLGAPIGVKGPAADYYIGANKLNACPLIFIRKVENNQYKYLMWHLSYNHLVNPMDQSTEAKSFLPVFFNGVADAYPQFSMRDMFTSDEAEILVTNQQLLSQEKFHTASNASLFRLPSDLKIVSSGLEGQIRSYSVAYFPVNDIMLLCGYDIDSDLAHFWSMKGPFSENPQWLKLQPCAELIAVAESKSRLRSQNDTELLSNFLVEVTDELHSKVKAQAYNRH